MKTENKRMFNLQEVGFTDLEGKRVAINFDAKDFANVLFQHANSIEMDNFARAIHQHGTAEIDDQVIAELNQILPQLYKYRVVEAIKETLKNK